MRIVDAFAQVLKKQRASRGLSQEHLADLCNLDRTYISLLERGKRKPTINTIFALCESLNTKPSSFIQEVEFLLNGKK